MLSSSFAFRKAVADGRHLLNEVTLTLADGTVHTIDGSALTMGGITASGATSKSGTFSVGAAVVGTAEITLANYGGEWDDADFTGAEAVVKVGYAFEDGTTEMLRKGMYGVEQPESYDSTITLELRDNMRLFERDYSEVTTTYPATLQTIVRDVCQTCGVTMLSASFPRDSQTVASRPSDDNTSCLDVLAWAAQMAGCFCDIDPWGRLRVRWYDTSAFESEDWLDGGTYDTDATPYSDGDVADGGWFHGGGDAAEGGGFAAPTWATVTAIRSLTVVTDDVVVTGVRVVAADQVMSDGTRGADGESYLYGTDGYVLEVSGNPLVTYGTAQSVATAIGPAIVGMRFRPLTVTSIGDPTIEPGDPLLVIDRRQRTYRSWATSLTWKAGGIQSISCDAETPARNRADSYSAVTREIVQLRNGQRAEKSARDNAILELARQLAQSSGLYMTAVPQQDGSTIYYMHDKPTLAESQIVWKLTANALGISTDGGDTYPYGLDVTGTAILNRIYAIGIDGQYITLGSDSLTSAVGDARKVATDYITDGTSGTDFAAPTGNAKMRILPTGMEIFDGNDVSEAMFTGSSARIGRSDKEHITITPSSGINMYDSSGSTSVLFAGVSGSNSIVRVGKASGSGNVVMSSDGYVDVRNSSTVLAHFGYGRGASQGGGTNLAPYYNIGVRKSDTSTGNYSIAEGYNNQASGYTSHAEGYSTVASNQYTHAEGYKSTASSEGAHAEGESTTASNLAAHAEGVSTTASNSGSHAEGWHTTASGYASHAEGGYTSATGSYSHASGDHTTADGLGQFVCGQYNATNSSALFIVGRGSSTKLSNAFVLESYYARFFESSGGGTVYVNGTSVHSSDRRLKEHVAYLEDDATDLIRALRPVRYRWKGDNEEHYGFYAQDVLEADPYDTATVIEGEEDESLGFAPLSIDYQALIAPLVAYAQQLEKRIDQQQQAIETLTKRLDTLEGR